MLGYEIVLRTPKEFAAEEAARSERADRRVWRDAIVPLGALEFEAAVARASNALAAIMAAPAPRPRRGRAIPTGND